MSQCIDRDSVACWKFLQQAKQYEAQKYFETKLRYFKSVWEPWSISDNKSLPQHFWREHYWRPSWVLQFCPEHLQMAPDVEWSKCTTPLHQCCWNKTEIKVYILKICSISYQYYCTISVILKLHVIFLSFFMYNLLYFQLYKVILSYIVYTILNIW